MESDYRIPHYIRQEKSGSVAMGDGEFLSSYCNRIRTQLDYLASKSEVSLKWYTHTNPNGCWICDTFSAAYALLRELASVAEQLERNTDTDGGTSDTGVQCVEGEVSREEGEVDINSEVHNKDS